MSNKSKRKRTRTARLRFYRRQSKLWFSHAKEMIEKWIKPNIVTKTLASSDAEPTDSEDASRQVSQDLSSKGRQKLIDE